MARGDRVRGPLTRRKLSGADAAIDRLESLLAVSSITAVPMLKIDPTWEPLRDDPRYQALLAKYEN